MIESAVTFGLRSLVGILCEGDDPPTETAAVVFVNAGSTHRCGPNRLYTTLARRMAARGLLSLRFDIAGIGDSPSANGLGKFHDYATREVTEAMDYLARLRGCRQFVLLGLCGGADIAFDAGAMDRRADGLILINGAFVDGCAFARLYHKASRSTANRFYASRMFSLRRWWRLLTFQSRFWKRLGRREKNAAHQASLPCGQATTEMATADSRFKWDTLARRGSNVLLVYSEGSVFWDIYREANQDYLRAAYPAHRLTAVLHKNADHTFTLLSAQERLADQIEQWLDAVPAESKGAACENAATGGQT